MVRYCTRFIVFREDEPVNAFFTLLEADEAQFNCYEFKKCMYTYYTCVRIGSIYYESLMDMHMHTMSEKDENKTD